MTISNSARIAGSFAVLLFSFVLQGCSKDNTGGGEPMVLDTIQVTPGDAQVNKGSTQQFTASAHFKDGTITDVTDQATWSSSNTSVASVSDAVASKGLAQALAIGDAAITAAFGGKTGSAALHVGNPLDHIEINPLSPSIAKGTTQQFAATAIFDDGTSADVTTSVVWNSSNATVATIDGNGLAHGLAVGTTTISANLAGKAGGNTASTTLTVSPAILTSVSVAPSQATIAKGTDEPFVAIGTFSDNSTQDITEVASWNSSNPSVATVSNTAGTRGKTHGVASGTSTISATVQGMTGSAALTVTDAVVTAVNLTPPNPSIVKATSQQFIATATFSDSTTQDVTTSSNWNTSDATVATVTQQGKATGLKAGTSTISATYQGKVGSSLLTVTPATVTGIAITPTSPSIAKGTDQQFTATASFSDNTTQDVTASTNWSSSNTATATISNASGSQGKAHAVAPGSTTISAGYQGQNASTTLTVTNAVVASIDIAPANPSIAKGTDQQFSATAKFTDNTTQDVTTTATWSSSAASVATVSNAAGSQGKAHGVSQGTATISAIYQGKTSSTVLTVTSAVVTSIAISPTSPTLAKGTSQQFTATATFSDSTTQDVTTTATWSSSNTSVATISNGAGSQGKAQAVGQGSTTISASYQGSSKSTTLTVTAATVTGVAVTPTNPTIAKGTSKQFTATATFSDTTTQDVTTTATWTSSNTSVATISNAAGSQGTAQGVAQGTSTITATYQGSNGSTTLTVTAAVVTNFAVTPTNPTIAKGTSQQFTATATFSDNTTQNVTASASWSSSDTSVATVSNAAGTQGKAQGVGQGASTISASYQGNNASTTLTVTAAVVTAVNVTPTNPSIAKGTSQQFTASATFSDNTTQDVTTTASWASSNSSAATISNAGGSQGSAQGVGQGTSTISATFSSMSGSTTLTVTAAALTSINVTPTNPSVPKGTTKQFTATGTFTDNTTQDITNTVTWASSDTSTADVSNASGSKGLAAAVNVGAATISATSGGKTGSTTMNVTAATLASIQVTPTNPSLAAGFNLQFHATGVFSDNSTGDVTDQVSWLSTNNGVATVSSASGSKGLATGVAAGTTTIRASQGSVQGSTTLKVTSATLTNIQVTPANATIPLGTSQQYTATATFSDNTTQDITTQSTWASTDNTVATISNASGSQGLAQSVTQGGPVTISAKHGSATGSTSLTVSSAALVSIAVTPASASAPKGTTQQFTATGTYTDNSTKNITPDVTWSSSNTGVATISNASGSNGLASAVTVGTTTITAALSQKTGTAQLAVTTATLTQITISPANASRPLGLKQQYSAVGKYSDNSTRTITTEVTWASSNTAVATISNASGSEGLASTQSTGTTTISATQGSVNGTTNLTVTPVALQSIAITPANSSLPNGTSQQMTATGTYSDNSKQDLTTQVTWASSNANVADVSNASDSKGLAIGKTQGQVNVTATDPASSIAGTTKLTVTAAQLQSITVTPSNGEVPKGFTRQFTATGNYSDTSQQNITGSVSWSTFNSGVATVDTKGVVTGVTVGGTTLVASLNGISGNTPIIVTNTALDTITVTPSNPTIPPNGGVQLTATGNFHDGLSYDVTEQAQWSSDNSAMVSVSNSAGSKGKASAGALPGTTTIHAAINSVSGSTMVTRSLN